jgi:hypothetical protein
MPVSKSKQGDNPTPDPDAAQETVKIDRNGPERYRFVCPNGHPQWDRTNNHIWCPGCQRQSEQGADVEPEHWFVYDKRDDERIHWSRVEIVSE